MGIWAWILLYVLLFLLVQLLLYRYLADEEQTSASRPTPLYVEESLSGEYRSEPDDPTIRSCPSCGEENEAEYTYCRNCAKPLVR